MQNGLLLATFRRQVKGSWGEFHKTYIVIIVLHSNVPEMQGIGVTRYK